VESATIGNSFTLKIPLCPVGGVVAICMPRTREVYVRFLLLIGHKMLFIFYPNRSLIVSFSSLDLIVLLLFNFIIAPLAFSECSKSRTLKFIIAFLQ
jgi:hypothetical protein